MVFLFCIYTAAYASDKSFSKRTKVDSKQIKTKQIQTQQRLSPQIKESAQPKPQTQTGVANLPDLRPNRISFSPGKPQSGQTVTVWVTVWNLGDVESSPVKVKLVMSATHPPQGSNPPVFTATIQIDPVKPNKAKVATYSIPLTNATQGQWKAEATVDEENTIQEKNKSNNDMYQLFSIY